MSVSVSEAKNRKFLSQLGFSVVEFELSEEKGEEQAEDPRYIPGTEYLRVSKIIAKYIEYPQFEHAVKDGGFFCATCIYFYEGHDDCAIVSPKGESAEGVNSERIAPYAMCALWYPNWDVIGKK